LINLKKELKFNIIKLYKKSVIHLRKN